MRHPAFHVSAELVGSVSSVTGFLRQCVVTQNCQFNIFALTSGSVKSRMNGIGEGIPMNHIEQVQAPAIVCIPSLCACNGMRVSRCSDRSTHHPATTAPLCHGIGRRTSHFLHFLFGSTTTYRLIRAIKPTFTSHTGGKATCSATGIPTPVRQKKSASQFSSPRIISQLLAATY